MIKFFCNIWENISSFFSGLPFIVRWIMIVIGVVMVLSTLVAFFGKIKDDTEKEYDAKVKVGAAFEKTTVRGLQTVFNCPIYRNLLFKDKNGNNAEIDIAFVTKKGIFSVECKHKSVDTLTTCLCCDIESDEWKYMSDYGIYASPYKNAECVGTLKNPIKQNECHIEALKDNIDNAICFNMVAVNCDTVVINNKTGRMANIKMYYNPDVDRDIIANINGGISFLKTIMKEYPDVYTKDDVKRIDLILKNHVATKEQLKERAARYKKEELDKAYSAMSDDDFDF